MNVSCPSCGADNVVDKAGQEAVCVQCFNVWTVEEDTGPPETTSFDDATVFEGSDLSSTEGQTVAVPTTADPFADPFAAPTTDIAAPATDIAEVPITESGDTPVTESSETMMGMALDSPVEMNPTVAIHPDAQETTQQPQEEDASFTATGLFGRPRRSSLSTDEVLGGRKPTAAFSEASEDTVWGPDAPAPRAASDALWDAEKKSQSTEHFGQALSSESPSTADSAGASASASMDDPFADLSSDSGNSWDADPFANSGSSAPADADPFAADADPFAADADPFAADADPFANADLGTNTTSQGSADSSGLQEVGFDSLEFEDIEASEFDETLKGDDVPDIDELDDSMFELDVAEEEEGRGGSRRGRRGRRERKSRSMGAKIAAVVLTCVVLAGVGLGQTNMGYFGINLILGTPTPTANVKPQRPQRNRPQRPQAADQAEEITVSANSLPAYLALVGELEAKHQGAAEDSAIANALTDVLLTVQERYPNAYAGNPAYEASLEQLFGSETLQLDNRHKIRRWILMGKVEDAVTAAKLFETSMKVEDLHLLGRLAEASKDPETAVTRYEKAVGVQADYEPALRDLALLHMKNHDLQKARGVYAKLLELDPNHAEAKLAMVRVTIFEKKFPEAGQQIDALLTAAKEAEDVPGQFQAFKLKADLADAMNKPEEKSYALERALELQPGDVATATLLANSLRKKGKVKDALDRLQACADAGCTSPDFVETFVNTLQSAGEVQKAEETLTKGMETFPKASNLLLLQAARKLQDGHTKTAKQLYATIMETSPEVVKAHLAFARILVEEKRYDEAIKVLGEGAEKSGDKLTLLAEMAEIQMKTGYILKAKESMGRILTIDPGNLKIKLRFAKLLKELGHNDESAGYYKDLQEAGSLKGPELLDYALVLETMNRLEESRNFAQQVLDKDPQNLKANVLMGSLQVRSNEYANAKKVLERALGIDNHNSRAHYFLGVNELNQGNLEEATKMLMQAKNLDQEDLQIRQQLAEALAQSDGKGESRRLALMELDYIVDTYKKNSEGIDKIRQDPEVYLRRGQLHFRGSDLTKALADFKTAMQLDSSRQDVILEFASTLRARGRHADAAPYFKEVLRGDPKNATAHYNLARISMKSRKIDQAEKHFKQAADNGGDQFPDAHRYLGYLYKDRSLKVPACSNFKSYLALKHKNADREEIARLVKNYCR